jgi:hypothetical protein
VAPINKTPVRLAHDSSTAYGAVLQSQSIIAILGMDELAPADKVTVIRARKMTTGSATVGRRPGRVAYNAAVSVPSAERNGGLD